MAENQDEEVKLSESDVEDLGNGVIKLKRRSERRNTKDFQIDMGDGGKESQIKPIRDSATDPGCFDPANHRVQKPEHMCNNDTIRDSATDPGCFDPANHRVDKPERRCDNDTIGDSATDPCYFDPANHRVKKPERKCDNDTIKRDSATDPGYFDPVNHRVKKPERKCDNEKGEFVFVHCSRKDCSKNEKTQGNLQDQRNCVKEIKARVGEVSERYCRCVQQRIRERQRRRLSIPPINSSQEIESSVDPHSPNLPLSRRRLYESMERPKQVCKILYKNENKDNIKQNENGGAQIQKECADFHKCPSVNADMGRKQYSSTVSRSPQRGQMTQQQHQQHNHCLKERANVQPYKKYNNDAKINALSQCLQDDKISQQLQHCQRLKERANVQPYKKCNNDAKMNALSQYLQGDKISQQLQNCQCLKASVVEQPIKQYADDEKVRAISQCPQENETVKQQYCQCQKVPTASPRLVLCPNLRPGRNLSKILIANEIMSRVRQKNYHVATGHRETMATTQTRHRNMISNGTNSKYNIIKTQQENGDVQNADPKLPLQVKDDFRPQSPQKTYKIPYENSGMYGCGGTLQQVNSGYQNGGPKMATSSEDTSARAQQQQNSHVAGENFDVPEYYCFKPSSPLLPEELYTVRQNPCNLGRVNSGVDGQVSDVYEESSSPLHDHICSVFENPITRLRHARSPTSRWRLSTSPRCEVVGQESPHNTIQTDDLVVNPNQSCTFPNHLTTEDRSPRRVSFKD